jgi:uncharacterized protein (TIGR00369 family)
MTLRQLRDSLTSVPFNTLLGMRLHRVHRDGITIDCTIRNDLRNNAGVAHGGVAAAMADAAVGLKINYFLPVTEGRIFARSHLLRIGSTLCVGNVDLADEDGRAIGTAIVTYMLINPPAVRTSHLEPQAAARVPSVVPSARRVTRPSRRK